MKREDYIEFIMSQLDHVSDKLIQCIYWLINDEKKREGR